MTDMTIEAELVELAEATGKHLAGAGHSVAVVTADDMGAFEVRTALEAGDLVCRVQALAGGMWELVQPNGETLTSLGGRDAFLTMIERVVAAASKRAA